MHRKRILIADTDWMIIRLLRNALEDAGWQTLIAKDGDEALKTVEECLLDLVILSVVLPKTGGFEVCRRIREWSPVPIIALGAQGELEGIVKCLNLGADDYVNKPFGADELIARIKAVFRRSKMANSVPMQSRFTNGDLEVNFDARRVTVAGNEVELTATEFNLLQELVFNVGKALTYDYLLNKIWGPEYKNEREYIYTYVKHLRSKIEADRYNPQYIISIPRVGYRFEVTP